MPCSFHPHLHPSFVSVFSSHQCENTQETFTTMGLFTHLLLIRDLNVHWRRSPRGNWLRFLPHINKHSHKSGSWRALHSARLAVMGPRQACAVQLWNSYTEGLPSWFWWMDGHRAIGLRAGSDVWSAWCWEADVRQQSCFVFTGRGLSAAGFGEGFWWCGASEWQG